MTHEAYYKVLALDGSPCHGGVGAWGLPRGKRPGAWRRVEGELRACEHGLHLCRRKDLVHWLGPAIYRAEARGRVVMADNKVVVAEARLVERLPWDDRVARLFAADCAERALLRERGRGREPDERCWAVVAVARRYANGDASDAELATAWTTAWTADAALAVAYAPSRTSAWTAARAAAWDAARAAAWSAAWDAARSAAWSAAWFAARAAEWAAEWAAERAWQTDRLFAYLEGEA